MLLEDSQAKEALQSEVEMLDADLLATQGQLATTQAEYAARTQAFEEKIAALQAQITEQEVHRWPPFKVAFIELKRKLGFGTSISIRGEIWAKIKAGQ